MSSPLASLAKFREAERQLAQQVAAFEELRASEELRRALEFDGELEKFLARHKMTRAGLLEFLTGETDGGTKSTAKARRSPNFKARTYRNPYNGKTLSIKLASNKEFKGWVAQYGRATVDSWLVAD